MIRMAGFSALAVAITQVVGNGLHPPLPPDTAATLEVMAGTELWDFAHLIVTFSYFLFIPFVIGAMTSFSKASPLVRVGGPLIIVGAAIGVVQILTHLTMFKFLGEQYVATTDASLQQAIVFLFDTLWPYSVALEVAHLLAVYAAAMMFGVAMLDETIYPAWIGWVGIAGGLIAAVGLGVSKLGVAGASGDIIFGVSLIPVVVWIVAIGVVLLRVQTEAPVPQPA